MRTCVDCLKELDESQFYVIKSGVQAGRVLRCCKKCESQRVLRSRAKRKARS